MTTNQIKLAPSILSADFGRLAEKVAEATQAGAEASEIGFGGGYKAFVERKQAG